MFVSAISNAIWFLMLPSTALSLQRSEILSGSSLSNLSNSANHKLDRRVRVGGGSGPGSVGGIKDLFLIDAESRCDNRIATLNAWVQEAAALHTAVEHAFHHAAGWPPYIFHWKDFFGVQWNSDDWLLETSTDNKEVWAVIKDHINRVTRFLAGGGLTNPQGENTNEKPRLFCSGDAFELQDGSRAVRDSDGKDIATNYDDTTDLPTEYLTINRAFASQRAQGSNIFWVPGFKGYDISNKDSICPPLENGRGVLARVARPTSSGEYDYFNKDGDKVEYKLGQANRHMVLCPAAFSTTESHSVESLSETIESLYPIKFGPRDRSKSIDKMLTRSSTFYHELYHLTDNDHSLGSKIPVEYRYLPEIMGSAKIKELRINNAHNPESFVYIAQALYIYRNKPSDKERVIYLSSFPDDPRFIRHTESDWAVVSSLP